MNTFGKTKDFRPLAICLFVATMVLAACQGGPPQVSIEGAKAELSSGIVGEAMVTMNIRNQGGSDVLQGVKIDIPGAKASFHVMQGERMANVDTVAIHAKSNLEFKMGGSHIMIEDMPKTMQAGSKFNMTLLFQKSGEKQIPLTLQGASDMPMGHEHRMNM
ncbi:MAG TPA: copper chaperone PCu(A)C [Nitrospirota bacterium]|nr:copper chaperone PCu(A)C [Nitrospirota bacterium]